MQGGTDDGEGGGAEFVLGVVDDDHGAVRQVADGLVVVLAFLDEDEFDLVTDVQGGAHGSGQQVQIEDHEALELGDPAEVGVVGEEPRVEGFGELDELGIDELFLRLVVVMDRDAE